MIGDKLYRVYLAGEEVGVIYAPDEEEAMKIFAGSEGLSVEEVRVAAKEDENAGEGCRNTEGSHPPA